MSLNVTFLFETPQNEIATILTNEIRRSQSVSIVTGFATVEGVRSIESAITCNPSSLEVLVVGAATYQSFEALDHLLGAGVAPDRLHVHLGHTRFTTDPKAKHRFYRYHPMLHSKAYYMEHSDGTATAIVGSHNITGYALKGLNGEASVMIKGPKDSPEFQSVKEHIRKAQKQSRVYDPEMKDAYSWWSHQFFEGLSDKANDSPREGEAKKTIVILAESRLGEKGPQRDEIVYFELPSALGKVQSLQAEVHIHLFDPLPASPLDALKFLNTAHSSVWCIARGLELEQGGEQLRADWRISDHLHPILERVSPPFRPSPTADMQQIRVKAYGNVRGAFEYIFAPRPTGWLPVLGRDSVLTPPKRMNGDEVAYDIDYRSPNPEYLEWYPVTDLTKIEGDEDSSRYAQALKSLSPEQGSYVLMSMRRRDS